MKLSLRALLGGSVGALAVSLSGATALADSDDGSSSTVAPPTPHPVAVTVLVSTPKTAEGLIFLTPTTAAPGGVLGTEIVDGRGRPIWFDQLPSGESAFDLRVQRYHREPVLTWIQTRGIFSTGPTTGYIADRHYHVIATVNAHNGLTADIHELHLTRKGTALIVELTSERDLSRGLKRWLRKAGINRPELHATDATRQAMRFHDLRATRITWMAVRGDAPQVIQSRAGHTDYTTTLDYI